MALLKNFYGREHDYPYCSGCSTGGRQVLPLAQDYLDDYDGVAASAPAIYLPQSFGSTLWGHMLMQQHGKFPCSSAFERIREAVIAECDPLSLVGQSFN
jgi:S-formylglutathione hydrolase FrmB